MKLKGKRTIWTIAPAAAVLIALSALACRKPSEPPKMETLRVGVYADPICALLYVGEAKGMFRRHGLDVSLESYQAGAYAVADLLAGRVDMATATGFVLALQAFQQPDLRAIGTISTADINEVIARRDHGIGKPEDLRGKRIGISRGTANEFFLSTFLSFNGIRPAEVQTLDLKPADMVTALSEGRIDAAVNFGPSLVESKRRLGGNALSWSVQNGQEFYFLLLSREELIRTRPGVVTSLLQGLLEAEAFLKAHEKEAQAIVGQALHLPPEEVLDTWSRTRFRVRLDQDLLTLMEDEARWAIQNRVIEAARVPNYLPTLYLDSLEKLKPEAVSVVH